MIADELTRILDARQAVGALIAARIADKSAWHKGGWDLIYVDYRDQLTDEQVCWYLEGDHDSLWDSFDPWESDQRYEAAVAALEEVRDEAGYGDVDLADLDPDDDLRSTIEDYDTSNWFDQLVRNTGDIVVRVSLVREVESILGLDEGKAAAILSGHLRAAGLEPDAETVWDFAANGPLDWHDFVSIDALFSISVEDAATLNHNGGTVTLTDPHILLGDRLNGSGWEQRVSGTLALKVGPDNRLKRDRDVLGYSWYDTVGGYHSSFYASALTVTLDNEVAA